MVGSVAAVGPFWYRASTVAQRGVFLVGDAAGVTDPITGEGVAAGLREAPAFAAALKSPHPERSYRQGHPPPTQDPRPRAAVVPPPCPAAPLVERAPPGRPSAPPN